MKIIDISQPLNNQTPGWPGDTPFSYEVNWTKSQTGSVNVGKLSMSAHIGTHIDAPFHFDDEGKRVEELSLDRYIGKALVIDCRGKESIGADDLAEEELAGITKLLLYTDSWKDLSVFPSEITYLRKDIAPFLASRGIDLIGVDVPSVDPLDSKVLDAHHALHTNGIHILEGIVLKDVRPGVYQLIALPLPIEGADGCPVRAVLIDL